MPHKTFPLVMGLILLLISVTAAQDNTPSPITIHVVQREETLSQIALQYGVSVDEIITANSILDPNTIQIGQRLIIPNPQANTPGMITTHIVEPGETLRTIAIRYNTTLESLAQLNNVTSIEAIYIGQPLIVAQGAAGTLPPEKSSLHIVQPGETLLQIAVHYQIPLETLLEANDLQEWDDPLQIGQPLFILDSDAAGRFVDLPAPIRDFQLWPLPAVQGRTIAASVETYANTTVTGTLLDHPITFTQEGTSHYAMIGIHVFTPPGIHLLQIQIEDQTGIKTVYEARIYVEDGGYGQEDIYIPPELQNLLSPEVVQAELDRVSSIMTGFTPQRYFYGLMGLPSTGSVTSRFGTRRSYNSSGFESFHGGSDFGGSPDSPILAPADGVVVLAESLNVRGNTVIIDHGWGVYTGYWHQNQILVEAGQQIQRGEVIGTLGATGLVTGAHLHWEMWVGGVQVDPLQWLSTTFFNEPPAN